MGKKGLWFLCLALLWVLTACTPAFPAGMTADDAVLAARTAVILFSNGAYSELEGFVRSDWQHVYNAEVMEEAASLVLTNAGSMQSFRDQKAEAVAGRDGDSWLARVTLVAKYEFAQMVYIVEMDENYQITRFSIPNIP